MEYKEIVIRIPIGIMEYIKNNDCLAVGYTNEVAKAIKNGISLPKGHGRLIDADELLKEKRRFEDFDGDTFNIIHEETVINAPTVIEADSETDIQYEYAVEEYDKNGRFYRQHEVYSSLKEAKKGLANAKAKNANASSGHSFGIFKIVYKNGLEVEAERME